MNAADIMTHPVVTVTPETTITEAAQLMLQHRISGLPVVDGGAVVGIITEGDLLRRAETGTAVRRAHWLELLLGPERLAQDFIRAHARKVGEIMTPNIVSAAPHSALADVVGLMEKHHIKRMPVIDEGRLVGIISRANLVHALVEALAKPAPPPGSDDDIRRHILDRIAAEPWGPRFAVSVTVKDGVVDLSGTFTHDHERAALKVLVENTPGVKAIRDHRVWVDPFSGTVIPAEGSPPTTV
jgi:CBS domain-containing protein